VYDFNSIGPKRPASVEVEPTLHFSQKDNFARRLMRRRIAQHFFQLLFKQIALENEETHSRTRTIFSSRRLPPSSFFFLRLEAYSCHFFFPLNRDCAHTSFLRLEHHLILPCLIATSTSNLFLQSKQSRYLLIIQETGIYV
jgi:hypothetical protein